MYLCIGHFIMSYILLPDARNILAFRIGSSSCVWETLVDPKQYSSIQQNASSSIMGSQLHLWIGLHNIKTSRQLLYHAAMIATGRWNIYLFYVTVKVPWKSCLDLALHSSRLSLEKTQVHLVRVTSCITARKE